MRTRLAAAALLLASAFAPALALDKFRLANGGFGSWGVEGPRLGQMAGIFAKHGIEVETYGTAGAGETLQAVISGSADASVGVGTSGVFGAYAKGAPVRIFGSNFIGAGDVYYYVLADSPIRSFADATESNLVSYTSAGSSSNAIVAALIAEGKLRAKPVATGDQPNTLTQVLSGQISIGHASPPFGLKEIDEGKIRIIGTGNEAAALRTQSTRVDMVGLRVLTERREPFLRFVKAYRETLDWMKDNPEAVRMWSPLIGVPEERARRAAYEFQPRSAAGHMKVEGIDAIMAAAVRQKFLAQPLTEAQLAELIQIPPM